MAKKSTTPEGSEGASTQDVTSSVNSVPTIEVKKEFKAEIGVDDQAEKCMTAAASELKIHPGIIYRSRETTMKVKVAALNALKKKLDESTDMSDAEKAWWKRVQQEIAVK